MSGTGTDRGRTHPSGYGRPRHEALPHAQEPQTRLYQVAVAASGYRSREDRERDPPARKLAKLLYLDEVPAAYVPSQEVQSWRELIEHRRHMMDRQTTCKNAIRSLLRGHGKIAPKGLWTKKGLAWLKQEEMPTPAARLKRDLLLDELDEAKRRVRTVTKATRPRYGDWSRLRT